MSLYWPDGKSPNMKGMVATNLIFAHIDLLNMQIRSRSPWFAIPRSCYELMVPRGISLQSVVGLMEHQMFGHTYKVSTISPMSTMVDGG